MVKSEEKTVIIQIGNSDDKLSQQKWSEFWSEIHASIQKITSQIHFAGLTCSNAPWQNACWVCVINDNILESLIRILLDISRNYNQDSIAITLGETKIIHTQQTSTKYHSDIPKYDLSDRDDLIRFDNSCSAAANEENYFVPLMKCGDMSAAEVFRHWFYCETLWERGWHQSLNTHAANTFKTYALFKDGRIVNTDNGQILK